MPHARLRSLFACALAIAAVTAAAAAKQPAPDTPTKQAAPAAPAFPLLPDPATDTLRFGADQADRMTLPVEIVGVGPYPFIIDTGSQRSIIAAEIAQRLSLPALPPVQIVSIAGRQTVPAVHLEKLKFGSQVVTDLPVLSIAHENLGGPGLIGLDGLKDKRLTLDFRKRRMDVGKSTPVRRYMGDANTIVVEAKSKLGQLILVGSKIDGKRVNVILDTGAEMSIGNMALFQQLKQKRLVVPPRPITITSVTGETIEAQFTIVRQISIASVQLTNVPMVFLDAAPFAELGLADRPSMLLGMKMLRMFDRVAIDFGNRHVDFDLPRSDYQGGANRALLASL